MDSLTAYEIGIFSLPFLFWWLGAKRAMPGLVILSGMAFILMAFAFSPPLYLMLPMIGLGLIALIGGYLGMR